MTLLCGLIASPDSQADSTTNVASPGLGRLLSDEDISQLPIHVFADGSGLPAGSGSSTTGKALYLQHCSGCHGGQGEGGSALELVGDRATLATEYPDRGIAVFWPYAPTLFEYVRRSMPPQRPWSLSTDETYAVVAYLLEINKLIEPGTVMDKAALSSIVMPNRDGFIDADSH